MIKQFQYIYILLLVFMISSCVRTEVEVNGSISGTVREIETAKVIEDCSIKLSPGDQIAYSSNEGTYSFSGLQMGDYTLTAIKNGYCTLVEKLTVSAGKTLNHDIILSPATIPVISTDSVINLTANSATICGTIVEDGGVKIKEKGFYYGDDSLNLNKIILLDSSKVLTYSLNDLQDGKKYYYQIFAINEVGEGKGELKVFSTYELHSPIVNTSSVTSLGTKSVTLNGEITDRGYCDIISCGFYLGLSSNPDQKHICPSSDSSIVSINISDLLCNTTYYYCCFAENKKGESKGNILSFKTYDTSKPVVKTNNANNITATSATLNATLLDDGGSSIKEYGFYYGTSTTNLAKIQVTNIKNNMFSYTLNSLEDGVTCYFKAYAVNDKGESLGDINSFETITLASVEISTLSATNIRCESAIISALITSTGNGNIMEYGFYYGSTTSTENKVKVGSGNVNDFSFTISDLIANSTYFYKAYATNAKGETSGNLLNFTTLAYQLPNISTGSISDITENSANISGNVIFDGGTNLTNSGICYSTTQNPTINNNYCLNANNSNSFTCKISNLSPNTIYYVRAFATNNQGTSYGNEQNFTTLDLTYGQSLNGLFSISENKQVRFSGGNLEYQNYTRTWKFARHQYDLVGEDNSNIGNYSYQGWIDLFAWGTGDNPTKTVVDSYGDYHYRTFYDWGNNTIFGNSGYWRTLTSAEWTYIIRTRPNARNKYGMATINGVYGCILLPDNWVSNGYTFAAGNTSYFANNISQSEWSLMESAGAVFLPWGIWSSDKQYFIYRIGAYWTASEEDIDDGIILDISYGPSVVGRTSKSQRNAVRLVQEN